VNDALFDPSRPETRAAAAALRTQLGLGASTRLVLYAGKLVPAKQPVALLRAFLDLPPNNAALLFVGDGEEKPALLELARTAPAGTVHFLPFANQTEMPARLLAADVFALPSGGFYETWGLAINEAMHMGVPCLVSDRVGCQRDLVTDGETGWVFRATDTADLTAKLSAALQAVASPVRREQFRCAVRARIAGYTYTQTTAGLLSALASLGRPASS